MKASSVLCAIECRRFLMTIKPSLFSEEALDWLFSLSLGEMVVLMRRVEAMGGQEELACTWKAERKLVQAARDF